MNENIMEYNYVVFGSPADYYVYGYSELNRTIYSKYYSEPFISNGLGYGILRLLRKAHMTPRLNKYIHLPLKSIWNKYLFVNPFSDDKPICFLFFSSCAFSDHINYGFIDYLKKNYKDSKYVVFYQDLVNKFKRTISLDQYKELFDLVISFDYSDCQKYGLVYHSLVYSDIDSEIVSEVPSSDVYFCGAAKNRLDDIISAYNWFLANGFKCDFNIISKNTSDKKRCSQITGLHFYERFNYLDNLKHVKNCKYMLEIMQKGGTGYTIRACEAVIFNKKLVSNNKFLKQAEFYNPNDIIEFDCVSELSPDMFDLNSDCRLKDQEKFISPIEFLKFIDLKLTM